MSIKELVAKIKSGDVKSYDIVKSYIDVIEKKENKIDAFLLLQTDEALEKAKEIDEKVKNIFVTFSIIMYFKNKCLCSIRKFIN